MKDSEDDILIKIRTTPNEALVHLYKNYRKEFLSWSLKNYGTSEPDALDCFQDAVIVFYRNVVDGKISNLTSSEKTYLFAIGKNFIKRKTVKMQREVHMDEINNNPSTSEDAALYTGSTMENRIADLVKTMRDPCKSILRYFYFRGFTMDEIANKMKYKNAQTVKAQKVRCIKEIQRLVQIKIQKEQ